MMARLAGYILMAGAFLIAIGLQGKPLIITNPTNEVVSAGETAQFMVGATGDGPLTYQWRCNGTNLPMAGVISTVAGHGTNIYAGNAVYGDGGWATNAILRGPFFLTLDNNNNLYISDTEASYVRRVDTNGIITTIPDTNNHYFYMPSGIAMDASGNLFVAQFEAGNYDIRELTSQGATYPIATNIHWYNPNGMAMDARGNLFVADTDNHRVRKIHPDGSVETVAGTNTFGDSGDGGSATNAEMQAPNGVAVDSQGDLYIADWVANNVRKVDASGIITTFAGNGTTNYAGEGGPARDAGLYGPRDVKLDAGGNLYIADFGNNRIRKVDTNGMITTVAGNGTGGYAGDGGDALDACLRSPASVALDANGNLFIDDYGNNCIRKVAFTGLPNLSMRNVGMQNAGEYSVVVSDSFGSVTSSVASLNVNLLPLSASANDLGAQLQLRGQAGNAYVLQAATNLVPPVIWQTVATNLAGSNGWWSFTDTNANSHPATYYRIISP